MADIAGFHTMSTEAAVASPLSSSLSFVSKCELWLQRPRLPRRNCTTEGSKLSRFRQQEQSSGGSLMQVGKLEIALTLVPVAGRHLCVLLSSTLKNSELSLRRRGSKSPF